jgi:hypothetical protein
VSQASRVPEVTIKELKEQFEFANRGGKIPEEWLVAFGRVSTKWEGGTKLTEEEIEFLATSLTALSDTFEDFLDAAIMTGFEIGPYIGRAQSIVEKHFQVLRDRVMEAWKRTNEAFGQFLEANERPQCASPNTQSLKDLYAALDGLRHAAKDYSGTPRHRQRGDPTKERAIYRMHKQGQTYGQIANQLPAVDPRWKVSAKQAERIDKRYREREGLFLRQYLREIFKKA